MNSYLEKSIRMQLLKLKNETLTSEDLEKITDLGLNNFTFSNKAKNIDLAELSMFPNLTNLTLQHFNIAEKELETLQQLNKLKYLKLASCNIVSKEVYKLPSLETLAITSSDFKDLSNIELPRCVTINDINRLIDISNIIGLDNVEQLRLNNIKKVFGINIAKKMPNLKVLNIDGTEVDDIQVVEELKQRIIVSQEDESRMIR